MQMQVFEKCIEVEGKFRLRNTVSILHLKLMKIYPDITMFIWGGKYNWYYKFFIPFNDEKKIENLILFYEKIDIIRFNRFWVEYTKNRIKIGSDL